MGMSVYRETDSETGNSIVFVDDNGLVDWEFDTWNPEKLPVPRFSLDEAWGMLEGRMRNLAVVRTPKLLAKLLLLSRPRSCADGPEDTLP